MPDPVEELAALVEVCNDLAAWLADLERCSTAALVEAASYPVCAEWHARLSAQLAEATACLTQHIDPPAEVACATCGGPVRVADYHDGDDGDRVCEACCPACQTAHPADVPGPPEVLP